MPGQPSWRCTTEPQGHDPGLSGTSVAYVNTDGTHRPKSLQTNTCLGAKEPWKGVWLCPCVPFTTAGKRLSMCYLVTWGPGTILWSYAMVSAVL